MFQIILTLSLVSTFTFAQSSVKPDECTNPGEVLSKDFSHLAGDEVVKEIQRTGVVSADENFQSQYDLKNNIYNYYKVKQCTKTPYNVTGKVCNEVDPQLALGRGNELFRIFYDVTKPMTIRATLFFENIKYGDHLDPQIKNEYAFNIVKTMVELAVQNQKVPTSSSEFEALVSQILDREIIDQMTYEQLIMEVNLQLLGFIPPEGVETREGSGNENFSKIFDFTQSIASRAAIVKSALESAKLNDEQAKKLAQEFILFANNNGVPQKWADNVIIFKNAFEKEILTEEQLYIIIHISELENRDNLGFTLSAKICKEVTQTKFYNKIKTDTVRDLKEVISTVINISLKNAPLLSNEKESFTIYFDGLKKPRLNYKSLYNSYTMTVTSDNAQVQTKQIELTGLRKKVTPENTLAASMKIIEGKYHIQLQDRLPEFKLIDGTIVEATLYKDNLIFPDEKLKIVNIKLDSKNKLVNFAISKLSGNKRVYAKIRLKRTSQYFNNKWSRKLQTKKISR